MQKSKDPDYTDITERMDRLTILVSLQFSFSAILLLLNCFADAQPIVYDERLASLEKPCPRYG